MPTLDREGYPLASRFLDLPAERMHYVDGGRAHAAPGRSGTLLFVHGTPVADRDETRKFGTLAELALPALRGRE